MQLHTLVYGALYLGIFVVTALIVSSASAKMNLLLGDGLAYLMALYGIVVKPLKAHLDKQTRPVPQF